METPFSPDYATARDRFRAAASAAGARLHSLPLEATGPDGLELTIDIAHLGAEQPDTVVLHSCGLHGVEGFAGSAIQLQLLRQSVLQLNMLFLLPLLLLIHE